MKNKLFICVSILIAAILVGICVYFCVPKNVETLANIKIIDPFGNEIENYEENKMPFTINNLDENKIVKVNGEVYTEGRRFYEPGEYKIEVRKNGRRNIEVVNIKDIEKSKECEYNIYISTSTLPAFMAVLNMEEHEEVQGFFWTQKDSSLNLNNIKNQNPNLKISEYMGASDNSTFFDNIIPELQEYIKGTLQQEENAFFNLYVDDYRFYLDTELFAKIGITDNRYNYYFLSDGTWSYTKNFATKSEVGNKEFKMREENGYDNFIEEKENYYSILEGIRSNQLKYNNMPGSYMADESGSSYIYDYLLIATLRDNVQYILQFPQMIDFKDERVTNIMQEANFVKVDLRDKFINLSDEQKQNFLTNINLDKATFDKEYFKNEDDNYLIITGAKPYYGDFEKEDFEDIMKKVKEDYGKDFILLYKPHPSALPNDEQSEFLENLGIKVLPGKIPMEAIMFIYPNIKIGGFASSLYMSAEEGQTEFFFAKSAEDLVEPLNWLYSSLFSNAKFYN